MSLGSYATHIIVYNKDTKKRLMSNKNGVLKFKHIQMQGAQITNNSFLGYIYIGNLILGRVRDKMW